MIIRFSLGLLVAILAATGLTAQQKQVTDLPDISIIGQFNTHLSQTEKKGEVSEIELAFSHYLYPTVKADVYVGIHKEEGKHTLELEEAMVNFSDLLAVAVPQWETAPGIGAIVGKKRLGIGRLNPLHSEQRPFIANPAVVTHLFGVHGLAAEGLQLNTLLPLPIFSQLELGFWTTATHEEHEKEHKKHEGMEYGHRLATARLWNSVAVSSRVELEWGLNYLLGNATASKSDAKQDLVAVDAKLASHARGKHAWDVQAEYYTVTYGDDGQKRHAQTGAYMSGVYGLTNQLKMGLRAGYLGKHGHEGKQRDQVSILAIRQLTETTKFNVQYQFEKDKDALLLLQFIFGMGPHAHALQ